MPDLSITAANVLAASDAVKKGGTAGATITAGQSVYLDSADSKYKLTDANVAGKDAASGIALNGASDGQPITVIESGNLNPGATVVVGKPYVVSGNPGGIAPVDDLTTGWKTTILGVGTTASNIAVDIQVSGAEVP